VRRYEQGVDDMRADEEVPHQGDPGDNRRRQVVRPPRKRDRPSVPAEVCPAGRPALLPLAPTIGISLDSGFD
jgi:hypothetical protein